MSTFKRVSPTQFPTHQEMVFSVPDLYTSEEELEQLADRMTSLTLKSSSLLELLVCTCAAFVDRESKHNGSRTFRDRIIENVQKATMSCFCAPFNEEKTLEEMLCCARLNAELYCRDLVSEEIANSVAIQIQGTHDERSERCVVEFLKRVGRKWSAKSLPSKAEFPIDTYVIMLSRKTNDACFDRESIQELVALRRNNWEPINNEMEQ